MNKIKEFKELKELKDKLECFLKNIDELEMEEIHSKIVCFINDLETVEKEEFDFEKWKKELEEFCKNNPNAIKIGYRCTSEIFEQLRKNINALSPLIYRFINKKYGVEIIIDDINPIEFFIIEEKPKVNDPWEPKYMKTFFYIDANGFVYEILHCFSKDTDSLVSFGNRFKTREEAEKRAKEIKVYNLLQKFSDANGGDKIDWKDLSKLKYFIYFDFEIEKNRISFNYDKTVGVVYFISEEVAEEALKKYQKELEELVR